ncbi:uncharacterized protein V6R79_005988 [Siganus canaliculatus]
MALNAPLDSIRFVRVSERVRKDLEEEKQLPRKADYEELLAAFMFSEQELDQEKAKRQGCEEELNSLKAGERETCPAAAARNKTSRSCRQRRTRDECSRRDSAASALQAEKQMYLT